MGFSYDSKNNVWVAGDIADLTATIANNFMQWSQPYNPYQAGFNHELYNNNYDPVSTIKIAQQSVMFNGYGRGIGAESFPVVNKLIGSNVSLSNGSYSFADLQSAGMVSANERIITAQLYVSDLDRGNLSAADSAYVHGTVGFALQSATRFIVEGGRVVQVKAHIGALNDNFDFNSSTIPSELNALVFLTAGPDSIPEGAQVILVYTGDGKVEVVKVTDHCFCGGTLVSTPTGQVPIESIRPGDFVLSFNPSVDLGREKLTPKRVVRLFRNETEEWLLLSWRENLEDRELIVTLGHHFLDAHGQFRRIDDIIEDTEPTVVLADGSLAQVRAERIVWSEETRHLFEEVEAVAMVAGDGLAHSGRGAWCSYNFEVEDLHTYVAGGVRVHNDSQATIDLAGNLGRTFGTQMANVILDGESQFTKVVGGSVIGTVTENLAEVIASTGYHMFDPHKYSFKESYSNAVKDQLGNIKQEFIDNLQPSMASLMIAELGEKLGLEGFGAQLFNTVGTSYAGSLYKELAQNSYNLDKLDWGKAWTEASSGPLLGSFFGSALAGKILPAETFEGSMGGSLGSIIGSSSAIGIAGGMNALSGVAAFVVPGVGAFIGTLLGTLIGDLFGNEPEPGASFWMFAEQQGENITPGVLDYYLYATAKDGFPKDYTENLGDAVIDISKSYMSNIGAFDIANANIDNFSLPIIYQNNDPHNLGSNPLIRVLQRMNIDAASGDKLKFFVNGREVSSAEAMVDGAISDFLKDSQPIGGDLFMKRAIANSSASSSLTAAASMATGAELERYYDDKETINALLASAPESAFAAGWVSALASAEELQLTKLNQVDFNGGLGGFLASLVEAGLALDHAKTNVQRGIDNKVLVNVTVEDVDSIPSYIHLFAHGAKVTTSADGSTTIQFTFLNDMSAVGYKSLETSTAVSGTSRHDVTGETSGRDLWIAPDNRDYNFSDIGTHTIKVGAAEIESSDDILSAGGGDDSILGGTGWDWISGGSGNDTLHGGDQDDTVLGGAGNDLIYGGRQMDYLEGGAGADTIYGTAQGASGGDLDPNYHATDFATVGYKTSNAAVYVSLGTKTASGGHANGDDLHHIINLVGSNYNDKLVGNGIVNRLEGGAGADTLDGGNDTAIPPGTSKVPPDFASYFNAPEGVVASLLKPSANTGDAAGDVYLRIEGLEGSNFDDMLIGNDGDNFLMGMAGNDTLIVGKGQDSVRGGFGFDVMSYRNNSEALKIDLADWKASSARVADDVRNPKDIEAYEATDENDTLLGSSEGDVLIGMAGNDIFDGRQGNDVLNAGDGSDTLNGGAGADTMTGGAGNDLFYINDTEDKVIEGANGGTDRILTSISIDLTRENESYYGGIENVSVAGSGNLSIRGSAGANILIGNDGDDYLYGRGGQDKLEGRDGDDTFTASSDQDTIYGGVGTDTFDFSYIKSGTSIDLMVNVHSGFATGTLIYEVEAIIAGAGDDTLRGNGHANSLDGGAGDDLFIGNGGSGDKFIGGSGSDRVSYIRGPEGVYVDLLAPSNNTGIAAGDTYSSIESLAGSSHGDTLRGSDASNIILGDAGSDQMAGLDGNDSLWGEEGNDTLVGGEGADKLFGGAGNDVYVIDDVDDRLNELVGGGHDRIHATVSIDLIARDDAYLNVEAISLAGSSAIYGYGDAADNSVAGNIGANRLAGRSGNDTLHGGAGADTFVFRKAYDRDVIIDFANNSDAIQILDFGVSTYAQAKTYATQTGADVEFDFGGGDVLTVKNTTIAALSDDLIFV